MRDADHHGGDHRRSTVDLYYKTPKGFFPQDDTGLVFGGTRASPDVSFKTMVELQRQVATIVGEDPAVAGVGSIVGGTAFSGSANRGTMFVSLKPLAERDGLSTQRVIDRLRRKLGQVAGIQLFMFPAQDLRVGGRQSNSQYQFTLWSADLDELMKWVPRVTDRIKQVDGVVDVSTDREQGGLQLDVVVDRPRASRARREDAGDRLPRSTMPLRSARFRRSTPSATSIASSSRSIRSSSATRAI